MPHWFERLADHMGPAYLRYSFTKGTEQEVAFLVDALGLHPGMRVLDVGCGPGRHSLALAARGIEVVGVDISQRFVGLASGAAGAGAMATTGNSEAGHAAFVRGDARRIPVAPGSFDAAVSLCQGGFGLVPGEDDVVVGQMAAALRPGGRLALSAFSSYFAVRFLEETDTFDAALGVNHEKTVVKDEHGEGIDADLWTSCFTPRELRLLARVHALEVEGVWSVTPGAYGRDAPDLEHPEYLLVARRPPA